MKQNGMPSAVLALTAGAFGIGTAEFIIMGLLLQVATDLHVSVPMAGLLVSGYALGVCVGAPLLTLATRALPRKGVLQGLIAIFIAGNALSALAPSYGWLLVARLVTSLTHGTFFGVGSVVASGLVAEDRRASAIATMFMGLTVATLLGVPFGAWLGLQFGWRAAFWAVAAIGAVAFVVLAAFVPRETANDTELPTFGDELAVLHNPQVLLGLAMTVLGFAGLFTVFTFIQPILTGITGYSNGAVSMILLLFGAGFTIGNYFGGRWADRGLPQAVIGTLTLLLIVLIALAPAIWSKAPAALMVGLLGAAAFATVAPLQLLVLERAGAAGQTLASSLNIAAFNLGNALGAWIGGLVIEHGPGLSALPVAGAGVTAVGLLLTIVSLHMGRRVTGRN
jgi:DHA1 family inner membrane transport protein